ncbi:MAG: hypothetical protein NTX97_11375 [Bacteroidetes bacterium]|nr:hypothetical protein [Bacteroidota bacterium]
MKKLTFLLLLLAICGSKSAFSQKIEKADSLGLPGDNLNLYAVLDLFQKSETFEVFEKKLNSEDSKINNLDLNNDDKIDYIKVIDHQTGESHAVVLQVLVNEKETQDVAVIEIEKDKNGKVMVQIVGNEELYGKDYIVEPTENDPTAKVVNPNKKSDTTVSADGKTVIINNTTNNYNTTNNTTNNNVASSLDNYVVVSNWPMVHYIYAPAYVVYVSPWYWYSYPMWWNPWTPWYWHNYYWHHYDHFHNNHYGHYHRTYDYRAPNAHNYYGPRKTVSTTVQTNRTSKVYQKTYDSKDRAGDGRVKPGTSNPAFNNKPRNNNTANDNRQKPNNEVNNPASNPKGNRVDPKGENKPSGTREKPSSNPVKEKPVYKPSQKPAVNQPSRSVPKSSTQPQKQGGNTNRGGRRMGR